MSFENVLPIMCFVDECEIYIPKTLLEPFVKMI